MDFFYQAKESGHFPNTYEYIIKYGDRFIPNIGDNLNGRKITSRTISQFSNSEGKWIRIEVKLEKDD